MKAKPALLLKPEYQWHSEERGDLLARVFVRLTSRWRAYAAAMAVVLAMFAVAAVLVWEVDRGPMPGRPAQTSPIPDFPPGYAPSPSVPASFGLLLGKASMEEQRAAAKSAINRVIEGQLDQQSHEMLKQFPEYGRCQNCLAECEQALGAAGEIQLQECRRNCIRTCSDRAREIMDGRF